MGQDTASKTAAIITWVVGRQLKDENHAKTIRQKMNKKQQEDFSFWLDKILIEIEQIPVAWNFNLVEPFSVGLVGTKSYSRKDEDWASDEIYSSIGNYSNFEIDAETWEIALNQAIGLIENYLTIGRNKEKLLESYAVGCGFVDGDLKVIYENPGKKFRQKKSRVTLELINELPIFKICAWLVVYAGYNEIDKTIFAKNFTDFMVNKKQPTEIELTEMKRFLFESMDRKKIKL